VAEDNLENLMVIEEDGKIVAHAGARIFEMRLPHGEMRMGDVGAVCCHPDYRRRGYGEQCMQAVMERIRDLDCDVGWLATPIPDWYRGMGWEIAGRVYEFEVNAGNLELLPELENVEILEEPWPDVEAMLRLFDQHELRSERTAAEFAKLVHRPDLKGCCAHRGEELLAYILSEFRKVVEYAGPPELVAGLVREVFPLSGPQPRASSQPLGQTENRIATPVWEDGLVRLLQERSLPYHYRSIEMLWPVNLPRLLRKQGLEDIRVDESGDMITLRRGEEAATLTRQQSLKLLFGPERPCAFAADVLPLPFYHWELDWC
jgi:ribosomal protein S18 acetylase RimI-like enzyme